MVEVYPLFVCCKHGELSYDYVDGCCGHTVGFNKTRKITNEFLKAAPRWVKHFRDLHKESCRHEYEALINGVVFKMSNCVKCFKFPKEAGK